ncbi:class I SAM-dependent methyltransferase [bacterium]|nr:class I SAM-dependent methyltransferase [bacterium]MBU1073068.1 class I SAM-dependent methyltransferase [bacterium]MBU1674409.1 class I SAM-dependent methyltransferase [bacterium]
MAIMTRDALDAIQTLVNTHLRCLGRPAEVLEAGCGRFKHFDYPVDAVITGLDISREQLDLNDHVQERCLGDVQTWRTERQWDATVSMYVLEHLDDPARTVRNMLDWTRPGGLVVLGVPNLWSLRGLITKLTPFWFHKLVYRLVYRRTIPPFPTTLKLDAAPASLRELLAGCDLLHEGWAQERIRMPFALVYEGVIWIGKILSLGRWRPEDMNYYVVARKPGEA